jgi:xanthine dehydrogenase YagS FAD-binding subunit
MKAFEYFKVTSVADAVALLAQHGEKAALLAGGSDLLGMMKDSVTGPKLKTPQYLIGIKAIKGLSDIKEQKGGVRIGAAASITDISSSALLAGRYPLLVQAAGQVAVPQIRNMATLGGNLCQRPRCWYFRGKFFKDCLRKGGNYCYAPAGENQYHAVLGAGSCHMVYPSDLAPALTALNARVEIAGLKGKRTVPIEQFYVHPDKNVLKENILALQEMVNLSLKNDIVTEARVVLGGVAPVPLRSVKAETALKGKRIKDVVAAASREATVGAQSLQGNGYKIIAAQGLVEKALSSLVS